MLMQMRSDEKQATPRFSSCKAVLVFGLYSNSISPNDIKSDKGFYKYEFQFHSQRKRI